MIRVKYDPNCPIAFNDGAIQKIAEKIVLEHGSTEEVHHLEVGQDLFVTAIRSFMRQYDVDYNNLTIDIVVGDEIKTITLTDYYRLSDYTHIPDLVCEILMPLM